LPRAIASDWFRDTELPPIFAQDARKGISATATDIDSWADQSGNVANATATTTARPTIGTWASDGGVGVSFNGTANWLAIDGPLAHCQGTQSKTIVALVRATDVSGSRCLFGGGGAGSILTALQGVGGVGNLFTQDAAGAQVSLTTPASTIITGQDQLIMYVHADGTNAASLWVDGKRHAIGDGFPEGGLTHTHLAIGATLGGGTAGANFWAGVIRHIAGFSGAGGAQLYRAACRNWLGGSHLNVVCDGNSLTLGQGSTGGNTYSTYLLRNLEYTRGRVGASNLGVGAQTTQQMIADFASQVVPLLRPGSHNILAAWEIGNDILTNQITPAQAVANYWTYVDLAVAAGFDVLAFTCAPRADFDGTGTSYKAPARITEANALVLAGYRAHGCFDCVDLGSATEAPQLQNTANTNYFADTVHHTNAGYSIVASLASRKITRRWAEI
jgi:hypothetical protein